jgi:hypothetical protein
LELQTQLTSKRTCGESPNRSDQALLAKVQEILSGIKDQGWILGRPENN